MNKKILFVEPRGQKTNFFSNSIQYPLLGPLYMATQLKNLGYNVAVIKEIFVDEEFLMKKIQETDILILTLLTSTAYRGYELAGLYKNMRPDGWCIAGGIHVSLMPEEVMSYVDQVVVGEGDLIIRDLVERKVKGKVVNAPPLMDLDKRPIIDFSLLVNYKKIKIPVMTSLGCPHGCSFCCVTKMYGRKYRFQSPDKTISEIKHHFKQLGHKKVFFYDDNFCANKKNSLKLFDKFEENKLQFLWGCQVRADVANDELFVKRMAEAGCYLVYIGFESINEQTLVDLKKNESLQEIEKAIDVFHKYGISVHGMFIFGTDQDGPDIFEKTVQFCIEKRMEFAQFFAIGVVPGTDLYESIDETRLIHKNWDLMDAFHVNLLPKQMSENQLMQGILYAHKKMYSWRKIISQFFHDFLFIFRNNTRPVGFRIKKPAYNFLKNIGFRKMIRVWEVLHAPYHQSLKEKEIRDNQLRNEQLPPVTFDNRHASNNRS